ncbi:membrane protein [Methylocucumis oryzae]|uniref:Membrane protein n=1 Tax=Methylocucumis oryzae TaxID=1632867 RepID=A0A0F3IIQ7_9GAMM|nr:membrane protein [Methylocucumis oryzae]
MNRWLNNAIGVLVVVYPFAVFWAITVIAPWQIAALLLLLLLLRFVLLGHSVHWQKSLLLVAIAYCAFAVWQNTELSLRFYPVLIDFGFFGLFAASLIFPPPIIERIARLQHPNLPEQGVRYTRKVTYVWCVFLAINSFIALYTALWGSFFWWSLYNGFISYVLTALLMGAEYWVRIKTQEHVR